jgi:glycerol-3-phosphate cytidylyltransferase
MTIGVVVGTFDMFHIGHLNLLRRAGERCEKLIAGVNRDAVVQRDKNKRPIICESARLEIVKSIYCISDAFFVDDNAPQFIKSLIEAGIRPDCYFRGHEPEKEHIKKENAIIENLGVRVVQFPYTSGISSTKLRGEVIEGGAGGRERRNSYESRLELIGGSAFQIKPGHARRADS